MSGKRTIRLVGLVAAVVLGLAGCLPSGGGQETADDAEGGGDQTGQEPQELVVWDIWARGVEREVADRLTSQFEQDNGVEVTRQPKVLDDLKTTLPLAMGQADGPDVASVNQGRADMGAMVEAGLLLDLTEYGQQAGWFDAFGENLLQRNMFSDDGQTFGEGNLYGVAPQAEIVGWFYNREKMEQLGAQPPQTFAELEQLLGDAQAAGETPITFGNSEGWPAIHTYGAIEHTFVDTGYLDELIFQTGDASFERPENVEAAEILQEWADSGYFTENFSGISYDDSLAQFASGEGVLMLTGSWIAGELDPQGYGFFLTPGQEAGELPPQTGGQGVPYGIRATTEAPELAQAYVDWMTSEEAAQEWAQAWLPSRTPTGDAVTEGTLLADLVDAWGQVTEQQRIGHYLDWATPTIYDTLTAELQQLLADSEEPATVVADLQADYAGSTE